MSQSNTSYPPKSIPNNQKSPPTSKTDKTGGVSSKAEKPNQQKVVAQKKPEVSQLKANAETAATKGSGPSLLTSTKKLDNVSGGSTNAAYINTPVPCGPCECWELDCDGDHPICNNCGFYGRRCSYGWWVRLGAAQGVIDKKWKWRTEPPTIWGRLEGSMNRSCKRVDRCGEAILSSQTRQIFERVSLLEIISKAVFW